MWKPILISALALLALVPGKLSAWDGYREDTGGSIEIESYDHRGKGEGAVEYYDYDSGEYRSGYLDMYPGGSGQLTDDETGEVINVDMN